MSEQASCLPFRALCTSFVAGFCTDTCIGVEVGALRDEIQQGVKQRVQQEGQDERAQQHEDAIMAQLRGDIQATGYPHACR